MSRTPLVIAAGWVVMGGGVAASSSGAVAAIGLWASAALVAACTLAGLLRRPVLGAWRWAVAAAGATATIAGRALLLAGATGAGHVLLVGGGLTVVAALVLVAERKRAERDGQGTIDALVVAVGGVAFTWQLAYGVSHERPGTGLSDLLLPLLAALGVAAVARLVFASLPPQPAGRYLAVGGLVVAAATALHLLAAAHRGPAGGDAVPVGLAVAGWGVVAAGLVHPALARLSAPGLAPPATVSRGRLAVLAAAQLAGPGAAALNRALGLGVDVAGLALCSAVAGLLVLARVVFLVGDVDRARAATGHRDRWYRQLVKHSADVLVVLDGDGRLQFASPAIEDATGRPPGEVLGRDLAELVHPDDVEDLTRAVNGLRHHEAADPELVQVRLRSADGGERWVELSLSDRLDDAAVGGIVINARDVTAKRRREAEQDAITAVGRAALAGTDMAGLAGLAVRQIELALEVDACELYRVAPSEGALLLEAAVGPLEATAGELVLDIGPGSGPGYAVQLGEAVLSNDLEDEARFATGPQRQAGLASSVSIIVRGHARIYGVLTISSRRPYAFGHHEVTFLSWMANELALTLERRSAEEETRHQALHDALTGLPNRVMFLNRLGLVSARAAERDRLLGVLFLDLDHFKLVNDSLGHSAGDQLLVQVSKRLRDAMRPTDLVARFGGDEFVVLCEELDSLDQAEAIAARVRENMDPPFSLGGTEVHVSASIGIAVMGASHDPEALLRDADAAMYKAKERGRARYEIFDFTMRDKAMARLQTANALHRAVELDQLVVHFQPIVELASGQRVGAEALVRWEHPEWGLIGPERFISVAETSGLIDDVAGYVLGHACRAIAAWQREVGAQLRLVSVNLSANQLSQPWLTARIAELIGETGADPRRLCLEITESAVMSDVNRAMRVLGELRELGVRVAIDDFGTGYSSLSYLRKLPLDLLKVDREFVRGLVANAEDRAITQTIVTLAHRLGLEAVAEGVEVSSQVDELVPLACDYAQGYHFGVAVPFEAMRWGPAELTLR